MYYHSEVCGQKDFLKIFYNLKELFSIVIFFLIEFINVMQSSIFSSHYFRFAALFVLWVLKTIVLLNIFVETSLHFFQDSFNRKFKSTGSRLFYNNVKVFTVSTKVKFWINALNT